MSAQAATHPEAIADGRPWPIVLPALPDCAPGTPVPQARILARMMHRERLTAALWNVEHAPAARLAWASAALEREWVAYALFEQAEHQTAPPVTAARGWWARLLRRRQPTAINQEDPQ